MKKLLRRFYDDESGVSAVEFALIAAFLLVPLLLGGSELGYRTWAKHQFENAAQAGMDYAIVTQCADDTCGQITAAAVQNAVQTATKLTNVTVAPASGCRANYTCYGCPGSSGVTFSATSATCANGGSSGIYAALTATYSYTPLFQACGDLLPSSLCNGPVTWTVTEISRVR
jgi:Flp pilus assembly protein TadG